MDTQVKADTTRHILIVDDNPTLRKTLSDILRTKGYAATAVATGERALEIIEEGQIPDVALIDLKLESMPGMEVLKEIKKHYPDVECIVLTGYATQDSAIAAVNLGAYSYCQKPYDVNQLLVTIGRAIEKQEAQEALRQSEEKYRTFFKTSRDPVFITSKDERWLDMNEATVELLGYVSREALAKVRISDLYENPEKYKSHTRITEKQGFLKEFPVNLRRRDGSIINTLVTSIVRKDGNGNVTGYQGTFRDLTEQNGMMHALRESEEKYRTIVESTEDCVFQVDRNCTYLFLNSKYASRFDLPPDQIIGRTYGEFHSPEEEKEFAEHVGQVLKTGKSLQHEHRSSRDGRYFLQTLSPVNDSEGRPKAVTVIAKEITELK